MSKSLLGKLTKRISPKRLLAPLIIPLVMGGTGCTFTRFDNGGRRYSPVKTDTSYENVSKSSFLSFDRENSLLGEGRVGVKVNHIERVSRIPVKKSYKESYLAIVENEYSPNFCSVLGGGFEYLIANCITCGFPLINDFIYIPLSPKEEWKDSLFLDAMANNGFTPEREIREVGKRSREIENLGTRRGSLETSTETSPASNIPVKATSPEFLFQGNQERVNRTNSEGEVSFQFVPVKGTFDISSVEQQAKENLKQIYFMDAIQPFLRDAKYATRSAGRLSLETCASQGNDSLSLTIPFYVPEDLEAHINKAIRKELANYLARRFPVQEVSIDVKDFKSRTHLLGILAEVKPISVLTQKIVEETQKDFLEDYIQEESYYPNCMLDSSKFVKTLPTEFRFSSPMKAEINVPSKYRFTLTNPKYIAILGQQTDFTPDSLRKQVLMSPIGSYINYREAEDSPGEIVPIED